MDALLTRLPLGLPDLLEQFLVQSFPGEIAAASTNFPDEEKIRMAWERKEFWKRLFQELIEKKSDGELSLLNDGSFIAANFHVLLELSPALGVNQAEPLAQRRVLWLQIISNIDLCGTASAQKFLWGQSAARNSKDQITRIIAEQIVATIKKTNCSIPYWK